MWHNNWRNSLVFSLSCECRILYWSIAAMCLSLESQHLQISTEMYPTISTSTNSLKRLQHTVRVATSQSNSCELIESDSWHGILLNRKLLFSVHSQTRQGRKSMHCPHKNPHFLSTQETHLLAPDILQVLFCLWDCSANHNMFINDNKHKNATLSVREIESGRVINVVSKKRPRDINYLITNMSVLMGGNWLQYTSVCKWRNLNIKRNSDPLKWLSEI